MRGPLVPAEGGLRLSNGRFQTTSIPNTFGPAEQANLIDVEFADLVDRQETWRVLVHFASLRKVRS